MSALIELRHVTRRFGRQVALDDVSATIEEGSITGLLGRNGAGKTSLMRILTAQDFPSTGEVRVFGEDPSENDRVLSRMCFIRESQRYPNNFKVDHVLEAGRLFYPRWDMDLARALVDEFGLPPRRQVEKLSRGMRSSMGIVVGLASKAPITIFDEPYLGLDATARTMFYDRLIREYSEQPRTIILSTHLIDEVSNVLEHALVLNGGKLVMADTAEALAARAWELTGRCDDVVSVAAGLSVMHRMSLGRTLRVTVDGPLDDERLARARSAGVSVSPVSLQDLVVRASLPGGAGVPDEPAAVGPIGGVR